MSSVSKNKLLTTLVLLLLIANAVTIAMFWLGKPKHPLQPKGSPQEFLVKELKLDSNQQRQLEVLVKEHRQAAEQIREKIKAAKDSLFALVKQSNVSDSAKQTAATTASNYTEQLDVLTLNHFIKVRTLCTPEQQKKFDEIIQRVLRMMAQPRPPQGSGGPGGPDGPREGPPPPPEH
jgi:Spy/CpxP family protein refolding chaperone